MKNISLKDAQKIVKDWTAKYDFKWSTYAAYCHLVEEIGEIGEAITVGQGERKAGFGEEGFADHSDMLEEIGDVLFCTIDMANRFGVDIEKCFSETIKRYNEKTKKRLMKKQ